MPPLFIHNNDDQYHFLMNPIIHGIRFHQVPNESYNYSFQEPSPRPSTSRRATGQNGRSLAVSWSFDSCKAVACYVACYASDLPVRRSMRLRLGRTRVRPRCWDRGEGIVCYAERAPCATEMVIQREPCHRGRSSVPCSPTGFLAGSPLDSVSLGGGIFSCAVQLYCPLEMRLRTIK